MVIVNALNTIEVYSYLAVNIYQGMEISNITEGLAKFDIQGPKSSEIIKSVFGEPVSNMSHLTFMEINYKDIEITISRSPNTGEDRFELYVEPDNAEKLWDELTEKGAKPCELAPQENLKSEIIKESLHDK
jgi:aminomethyltransferase